MAAFGAFKKVVASSSVAEPLSVSSIPCSWLSIHPYTGDNSNTGKNTGKVWIGGSNVKSDGSCGFVLGIPAASVNPEHVDFHPNGANIYNLKDIYAAVAVNGEAVEVVYSQL